MTLTARAQVDSLDSLQQAAKQAPPGKEHVDLLNKIAFAYSRVSLEKADQTAVEALQMATQFNYTKGIGDSYNNQAICRRIHQRTGIIYQSTTPA